MDSSRRLWPRSDLRVGDADRHAAVAELQQHFVEGRLTSEEYGERVSQALSARTFGDLAALMADLPTLAPAELHQLPGQTDHPEWNQSQSWLSPSIGLLIMVIGILAMVFVFTMPYARFHMGFFPWPLLIWGFFIFGRRGRRRY
jgi:hypothetical protein